MRVGFRVGATIRLFEEKVAAYNEDRDRLEAGIPADRRRPRPYRMPPFIRGYHVKAKCQCVPRRTDEHVETRHIEGYYAALDNVPELGEVVIRPVKS